MKMRFSIRELMLAFFIVALVIGWWVDHRRLVASHAAYDQKVGELFGGLVSARPYSKAELENMYDLLDRIRRLSE